MQQLNISTQANSKSVINYFFVKNQNDSTINPLEPGVY